MLVLKITANISAILPIIYKNLKNKELTMIKIIKIKLIFVLL